MPTKESVISVSPFGIEADGRRNNDLYIQNIPNCRLRSRIIPSRPVIVNKQSDVDRPIPRDQARHLGAVPEIPGMQLHVSPERGEYRVIDPLFEDEQLCERIRRALEADDRPIARGLKIRGVAPQRGTLRPDEMKTLVREMCWFLASGDARICKGSAPYEADDTMPNGIDIAAVDALPGRYLLNPGARIENSQPRYEDEYDAWRNALNSMRVS